MTSAAIDNPPRSLPWFLIVEGLLVVALGVAAVIFPVMAGVAAAVLFGWILIAVGAVGLVGAFTSRPRVHFGWSLVSAVLAIAAGLVTALIPLAGVMTLVVVIAVWLALDGVSSLMIGLDLRRAHARSWGWPIVSAVVDWALAAVLIFLNLVGDAVFVGIVVGIDLMLGGATVVMLGVAARKAA